MKKNTFALNVGEEALIEGFGVIKCIESDADCSQCCLHDNIKGECKGIEYNNFKAIACLNSIRDKLNLNGKNVIYILELPLLLN